MLSISCYFLVSGVVQLMRVRHRHVLVVPFLQDDDRVAAIAGQGGLVEVYTTWAQWSYWPVATLLVWVSREILSRAACSCSSLQCGAADAEIRVPFDEDTELKRSPFKAWSRSVYSHTCYAYSQGFLPCLFLTFRSIHLPVHSPAFFSQNLSRFFLALAVANTSSCVGRQNTIGHPAGCGSHVECSRNIIG